MVIYERLQRNYQLQQLMQSQQKEQQRVNLFPLFKIFMSTFITAVTYCSREVSRLELHQVNVIYFQEKSAKSIISNALDKARSNNSTASTSGEFSQNKSKSITLHCCKKNFVAVQRWNVHLEPSSSSKTQRCEFGRS